MKGERHKQRKSPKKYDIRSMNWNWESKKNKYSIFDIHKLTKLEARNIYEKKVGENYTKI